MCYTYDNNGNILTKRIDGEVTEYKYQEESDRLVQYGAEQFAYDNMGNPTTYRNMTCTWEKGRQLKSVTDGANTATYSYDVFGVRSGKVVGGEETSYVYENGKLLRQVTGDEVLDFYYGSEGVIGFKVSGSTEVANGNYLYRKNLYGDVTGIIDESGALVYEYGYSAFGKSDKAEETGIGAKNPFRYRGYYYDEETGLYYLKSRYYDPEVGRFITIDDISYLDPETVNGLNLYAYCGNNPVMRVDSKGNDWNSFWAGIGNWFVGVGNSIGNFFTRDIPNWWNNDVVPFFTRDIPNFFTKTIPDWWNNDIAPFFTRDIPNFFTKTIPDFFVNTFWNDWIVDKLWNQFTVGIIWQQGLLPIWNWLNGTSWYQILVKNIVLTAISTGLGALIGSIFGPVGALAGTIIGAVAGIIVGVLWDFGVSGINP